MLTNDDVLGKLDRLGMPVARMPYMDRDDAETYALWRVVEMGVMRGDGSLHGVVLAPVNDDHFLGVEDPAPTDEDEGLIEANDRANEASTGLR